MPKVLMKAQFQGRKTGCIYEVTETLGEYLVIQNLAELYIEPSEPSPPVFQSQPPKPKSEPKPEPEPIAKSTRSKSGKKAKEKFVKPADSMETG